MHWTEADLLTDEAGTRVYDLKWQLSVLVSSVPDGEPLGFLVSYLRPRDANFGFTSVYMHRMAILRRLQRRGIGRQVIELYLKRIFEIVDVNYVTLQTNDNAANAGIIQFYESLSFGRVRRVFYPDKTDWLMCARRSKLIPARGGGQITGH